MIHIFTKSDCPDCKKLKDKWREKLRYGVEFHDIETPEGLTEACMHEVVERCQKQLPVLVVPDEKTLAGFFGCDIWLSKEYKIEGTPDG